MPEATVLYSVSAAVIAGLVAWVGYTLATKKEPWSRPRPAYAPAADVPLEAPALAVEAAPVDPPAEDAAVLSEEKKDQA